MSSRLYIVNEYTISGLILYFVEVSLLREFKEGNILVPQIKVLSKRIPLTAKPDTKYFCADSEPEKVPDDA